MRSTPSISKPISIESAIRFCITCLFNASATALASSSVFKALPYCLPSVSRTTNEGMLLVSVSPSFADGTVVSSSEVNIVEGNLSPRDLEIS